MDAVVAALTQTADRLDDLADVAELMGDADGALRLKERAARRRAEAMRLLDQDA